MCRHPEIPFSFTSSERSTFQLHEKKVQESIDTLDDVLRPGRGELFFIQNMKRNMLQTLFSDF